MSKYDRVYYWKFGRWNEAMPNVYPDYKTVEILLAELERAGYSAVAGKASIGAPEGERYEGGAK